MVASLADAIPILPQHKVLDLLKGIVALGGERIGRAELIDHLWPDVDGDAGHKNLGRDDAILVHDGKVSLNGICTYLDIWAFEHRLRSFREANAPAMRGADGEGTRQQTFHRNAQTVWIDKPRDVMFATC